MEEWKNLEKPFSEEETGLSSHSQSDNRANQELEEENWQASSEQLAPLSKDEDELSSSLAIPESVTLDSGEVIQLQTSAIKNYSPEAGIVIAEFTLIDIDSPSLSFFNCEIHSDRNFFLIGRAPYCDYQVEYKSKYVADQQAIILYSVKSDQYIVRCLTRENPIWINEKKVSDDCYLQSGDIMKLGMANNAPRLRFSIEGETENKVVKKLSETISKLERGKVYELGSTETADIPVDDLSGEQVIAQIHVPAEDNHLLVSKNPHSKVNIYISGSEVHADENRILGYQQQLQVGNFFSLIHDQKKFFSPRTLQKYLFSDFVKNLQRGMIYSVGSSPQAHFPIDDETVPPVIAEIIVPNEGEYCLVKKSCQHDIEVKVDNQALNEFQRNGVSYGVNQVLKVGDYIEIRNNHRSLPPPILSGIWKKYVLGVFVCLLVVALGFGAMYLVRNYSDKLQQLVTSQNLMKLYQKNVFYIVTFDQNMQSVSSGTGFLLARKDAYDKSTYYLVTAKHVVQPWKYKEHKQKDQQFLDLEGNPISPLKMAAWPYGETAINSDSKEYLIKNSFTDIQTAEKLGELKLHHVGEDEFEQLSEQVFVHEKRSNQDLAVLKLLPQQNDEKKSFSYESWNIVDRKKLEVGESVIVLGYALGVGRLLNKRGRVVPVASEGRLSSECISPDFLELDVNQNQGSSGGPIINQQGKIMGVVSFTDQDKKLLYGIHGKILEQLMRP